jgi:hypothetical protein
MVTLVRTLGVCMSQDDKLIKFPKHEIEKTTINEYNISNVRNHTIDIGDKLLGCEFNRDECLFLLSMLYSRWRT